MNQTEIGKFITKCRKEKKLTQAQLAEKLNITDRAVSKWETGKSMPDSSVMLELCDILGITVNELLSGEKIELPNGEEMDMEHYEKKVDENLIALKKKDENSRTKNRVAAVVFSFSLLIGLTVCLICDLAITGGLTWSLIPASSIIFAWAVSIPGIIGGKRGIMGSLIALSVFSVPYLYLLSRILDVKGVFSLGAVMAVIAIVFLWIGAAVFRGLGKSRMPAALGFTFLLGIPLLFIINGVLSKMIAEPVLDLWDVLTVFILLILAFVSFVWGGCGKKNKKSQETLDKSPAADLR